VNISKISTYEGITENEWLQVYREINSYPRTGKTCEVTADITLTYGYTGIVYCSPIVATEITLPAASVRGVTYKFKRKDNETTDLEIFPAVGDTIDFAASLVMEPFAGAACTMESDGNDNWVVMCGTCYGLIPWPPKWFPVVP